MRRPRRFPVSGLTVLMALSIGFPGCLTEDQLQFQQAVDVTVEGTMSVTITEPSAGAVDFPLEVAVETRGIVLPEAPVIEGAVTGHWHLEVDGVMEASHQASSTAIIDSLGGGEHTLRARLVREDDTDLEPPVVSAPVTIQVEPDIEIVSPADQAKVSMPFTLEVAVQDFILIGDTEGEADEGRGHFHVYVDGEYLAACFAAVCELAIADPGGHQLMVELAGTDHYGLTPPVTDIIEVTVIPE